MTFYERCEKLAKQKSLSMKDLGKMAGITGASITGWKNGSSPRLDIAVKIANALGVNIQYLTSDNDNYYTVRQIAEQLGVSKDTVKNCIRRIMPNKMVNGKTTFLNEAEIALISKELKSNNNVLVHQTYEVSSQVINSTTQLELIANYKAASEALNAYLTQENELLKHKNEVLQIKLDKSKEWYSVKRMEKLNPEMKFNWHALKEESKNLGLEIKKVFDQNYGEVNAYHISVWESLYFDSINY